MITPEQKDALLIKLIEMPQPVLIDSSTFPDNTHEVQMIVKQFVKRGFVHVQEKFGYGSFYVVVEVAAHDHIQRGGFKFEEDIFRNTFIKLELELGNLEKANPSINFDNVTQLVGAVASGIDIYKHLNP